MWFPAGSGDALSYHRPFMAANWPCLMGLQSFRSLIFALPMWSLLSPWGGPAELTYCAYIGLRDGGGHFVA